MAEIIFQSKLDANKFYNHLFKYLNGHSNDQNNILHYEDRHIVEILTGGVHFMNQVKRAFSDFIMKVKRDDWFKEILAQQFYYEDPEEQQQIIDIIDSILEGQREDLIIFLKETNGEENVVQAVEQIFQEDLSFSFDSFVKFRLRTYFQDLEKYVELSIDEYKMEQEYQMFVQMLREFLAGREPKMNVLHLLFDEEITFFNERFEEMKRAELIKVIDRKLLVNHPVYVDSASIAPLLSLAPTTIYLYTNNPDTPLVRTIKNIFEERVTIKTYDALRDAKTWGKRDDPSSSSEQHA